MNKRVLETKIRTAFLQTASSRARDPDAALEEIATILDQDKLAFVLLFLPDGIDPQKVERAIHTHLAQRVVFGASSAGQITELGYEDDAFLALGFPKKHFRVASLLINPLDPFELSDVASKIAALSEQFSHSARWNRFGLIMPDGLSKQEDVLIATINATLPDLPVFGGSAAENSATQSTMILTKGQFHQNAALFLIIETDLDFQMVNFGHFIPTDHKLVVTEARPKERIIAELNGAPAAQEYARILGLKESALNAKVFAQNPFLIKIGDEYHIRSISKRTHDGALELLCAIDEGLILTLGRAGQIVRRMETELCALSKGSIAPEFILAFDCFLRRLEVGKAERLERASKALRENKVIGFNTFGEQHSGIHVNHTFIGIAFYATPSTQMMI